MNWDAVGAIAELLGATAVVASLVYVAVQIRQNTRTVRAAATKEAASTIRDWFAMILADPDLGRIFAVGVEGMGRLDENERIQFALIMFNFIKAVEDLHYQGDKGVMDPDLWRGWDYQARQYLTAPGVQEYWVQRPSAFSERFRDYVNSLDPDPSYKRVSAMAASADDTGRDGHKAAT